MLNLSTILEDSARRYPAKAAFTFMDKVFSYAEVNSAANNIVFSSADIASQAERLNYDVNSFIDSLKN